MVDLEPVGSSDDGDLDVVSSGSPQRGRHWSARSRRWSAGLLVVAVLLAAGAWLVDRQLQRHEFAALMRCVATSERALADSSDRTAAMAQYVEPALSQTTSASTRDGLYDLVANASAPSLPGVLAARGGCRAVSIVYVDKRLAAARTAYLGYLDARVDYLHAITHDGSAAFRPPDGLGPLHDAAQSALTLAAPDDAGRRRADGALAAG